MTRHTRPSLLAVVAALLVVPAVASASLVICASTPARTVCVCDSRAWLFDVQPDGTRTRRSYRDDYVKIVTAGRFVMGATNDVYAEPAGGLGVWGAWRATPPTATETAGQYLDRLIAALPQHMAPSRWPLSACVAVFGFAPVPDAVVATVTWEPGGKPHGDGATAHTFPVIASCGVDDVDLDPIAARLRPRLAVNPNEQDMVAMLRGEVATVARGTQLVGGPILAIVVDKAGNRWVK